jgi:hypothetical protein
LCNPSTQEAEAGGRRSEARLSYIARIVSKNKQKDPHNLIYFYNPKRIYHETHEAKLHIHFFCQGPKGKLAILDSELSDLYLKEHHTPHPAHCLCSDPHPTRPLPRQRPTAGRSLETSLFWVRPEGVIMEPRDSKLTFAGHGFRLLASFSHLLFGILSPRLSLS